MRGEYCQPSSTLSDAYRLYAQGIGYTGSTACDAGSTCVFENDYYSQCQPGTASSTPPTTTTGSTAPVSTTGLSKAFKAKGKLFWGTASDSNRFSNAQDSAVTIREFGGVTPENSMKWDAVSLVCFLELEGIF